MTWALVAIGGAVGTAVGLLLLREPSSTRMLTGTAVICALLGALSYYSRSPQFTALVEFGLLASAASMVAVGAPRQIWLSSHSILRSLITVSKRLAVYGAVALASALAGYLLMRIGFTVQFKLG